MSGAAFNTGFTTAGNKSITVSEQAMARGRTVVEQADEQYYTPPECVTISSEVFAKIRPFIKNGQLELTSGAIKRAFENEGIMVEPAVMQLTNFKMSDENGAPGTCARAKIYDGVHYYKFFFFSSNLANQIRRDNLVGKYDGTNGGEILLITKTHFSMANKTKSGSAVFVVDEYELLSRGHPIMDIKGSEHLGTPEAIEMFRNYKPTAICSVPWTGQVANHVPQNTIPPQHSAPQNVPPPQRQTAPSRAPPVRVSSTVGGSNVTPIDMITPYVNKWRIAGICTSVEPLKEISTKNGPSKVYNFVLTDKQGSAIRIAGFGETAGRASEIIHKDCSYYISGGTVKATNKRFNTTGHDYEITLRNDSEITPCNEFIGRPQFSLKICPLDRIVNHRDETVDILAVVDRMEPATEFNSKAGKTLTKREISLIDQTGTIVVFTLWNEQAKAFEDEALSQVIGIKGAVVKEWQGGVSLGSVGGTRWELSPTLNEVPKLYEWYTSERPNTQTKSLTVSSTSGGSDSLSRDLRFIGTATALQLGNEPDLPNGRYMSIKARINTIKTDNAIYQACSNEGCQKKVIPYDGQYRCEKCSTTSDSFKWNYMVSVELVDATGMIWVTVFAKTAEKLFGRSAQELGELKESDPAEYGKVFEEVRSKSFIWRVRAKPETYNEEMRIRYTIFDIQEVNWDRYKEELEKTYGALKNLFVKD